jgi:argininosuccinate synthase
VPHRINGVAMPLVDLIASLNTIAGAHGVGRRDVVEPGNDGKRRRLVCEGPAAQVLHVTHDELQRFVLEPRHERFCRRVAEEYRELIDQGFWLASERSALHRFVSATEELVTGVVRIQLFKGGMRVVGRSASVVVDEAASRALGQTPAVAR